MTSEALRVAIEHTAVTVEAAAAAYPRTSITGNTPVMVINDKRHTYNKNHKSRVTWNLYHPENEKEEDFA